MSGHALYRLVSTPMLRRRPSPAPPRPRFVVLLVLLASAAALPGCGQAQDVRDSLDYSSHVSRVLTGFGGTLRMVLAQARDADTPADVDQALRRFSGNVDDVRADLQGVQPPPSVAVLHRDLTASYSRWSAPIAELRRAVRTRSPRTIERGQREFTRQIDAIQRDIDGLLVRINTGLRRLSD